MQNQNFWPKQILLTVLFLSIAWTTSTAQEVFIKTAPFGLLDPINPKVHFAYERVSKNGIGIEIDGARFLPYDFSDMHNNKRGWLTAIEMRKYGPAVPRIKRFLVPSKHRARVYFGTELQFVYRKFTALEEFDVFDNDFEDVPVIRKFKRLMLKVGKQYLYPSGFSFELFAGTGISQIREIHLAGDGVIGREDFFNFSSTEAGSKSILHFEFGTRVSFQVKKNSRFSN